MPSLTAASLTSQPRREIVGAVDDQVMARQDRVGIVAVDPVGNRLTFDVWVALADKPRREIDLALADLIVGIERLALKVGKFDPVVVDDGQMSNARAGQRGNGARADSAGADDRNPRRL